MATESQIHANRRNAQKSTGPRTAAGKARSSRNGIVHGLTSQSPLLPGEDPAGLRELHDEYRADFQPVGRTEQDLVERIAIASYRLRRVARIEAGYFDLRLRFKPVPETFNQDGLADPLAWAFHVDCNRAGVLEKLGRYEGRLQREITRCLNDLYKYRAGCRKQIARPAVEESPKPPAPRPKISSQTNPIPPVTPAAPAASATLATPRRPPSAARHPHSLPPKRGEYAGKR